MAWYVIEGQPEGEDFLLYGFVTGPNVFREFRLSDLENIVIRVKRDVKFTEGKFRDIVLAPDE